jgi:hypothetical protein
MKDFNKAVILFCDNSSGKYIPKRFADEVKRELVKGIDCSTLDALSSVDFEDPEYMDHYWPTWEIVLNNCTIDNGEQVFHLFHDGDLWLLDYDNMTDEQRSNFGLDE